MSGRLDSHVTSNSAISDKKGDRTFTGVKLNNNRTQYSRTATLFKEQARH